MNDAEVVRRKAALRRSVLAARRDLDMASRATASAAATDRLVRLPEVWRSGVVALYASTSEEIDTEAIAATLRERGAMVVYPRVVGNELELASAAEVGVLQAGFRGIPEPTGPTVPVEEVDTVVLPGVAFDLDGGRLGHGGGHYDRLLARLETDTVRVGLCFSCQIVPVVPRQDHDESVDVVVSDHAVHRTGARRQPRDA